MKGHRSSISISTHRSQPAAEPSRNVRRFRRCLGIFLFVALSNASSVAMGATGSGPYCGIQCVYAALKMNGLNARFSDLLDPHYVETWGQATSFSHQPLDICPLTC